MGKEGEGGWDHQVSLILSCAAQGLGVAHSVTGVDAWLLAGDGGDLC